MASRLERWVLWLSLALLLALAFVVARRDPHEMSSAGGTAPPPEVVAASAAP